MALLLLGDLTEGCSAARTGWRRDSNGEGGEAGGLVLLLDAGVRDMASLVYAAEGHVSHRDDRLGGPCTGPHKTGGVREINVFLARPPPPSRRRSHPPRLQSRRQQPAAVTIAI